jgi:hypothetical protein
MTQRRDSRRGYAYQTGFITGLHPYNSRSEDIEAKLDEYEEFWAVQNEEAQAAMDKQYEKGATAGRKMRLNP